MASMCVLLTLLVCLVWLCGFEVAMSDLSKGYHKDGCHVCLGVGEGNMAGVQ